MQRKLLVLLVVTTVLWVFGAAILRLDLLLMYVTDMPHIEEASRAFSEATRDCSGLHGTEYHQCFTPKAQLLSEQIFSRLRIVHLLSALAVFLVPPAILWAIVLLVRRHSSRAAVWIAAIAAIAATIASIIATDIAYLAGLLPFVDGAPKLLVRLVVSAKADETWVCVWGEKTDNPGFRYTLRGDTLVLDQTQDTFRVLQNNQYGIVAVASMSEFVPRLNKPVVAFFAIAIDRSTGDASKADDISYLHGNCTKR